MSPLAAGYGDDLNRQRVKRELRDKLRALLDEQTDVELGTRGGRGRWRIEPADRVSASASPSAGRTDLALLGWHGRAQGRRGEI